MKFCQSLIEYGQNMGFDVRVSQHEVTVALNGLDRVMNWRRSVQFDLEDVVKVSVVERSSLEELIQHRALGWGTHNGEKRPNRRRVGTMLGRDVAGKQFWAVPAGEASTRLLVLDMSTGNFTRAVLEVDDPESDAATIEQHLRSN